MPTGTRFKTGNTATITLATVLTTGVTTSWVGNIVSINPGEWTIGERDVSLLADTGFLRVDPHDLAVTNEVAGVARFSASVGLPTIGFHLDSFFKQGHYAQAAALLAFDTLGVTPDDKTVYYFAGIDGARFKRPVEPGQFRGVLIS